MKTIIRLTAFFSLLVFVASCSCDRYDEAKSAINAVKNLAENADDIQESMDEANKRMEDRKKRGDTIAIHYETLAEYLPESFDGYKKDGDMNGGTTTTPGLGSFSNVGQRYLNADGDEVEIDIVDYNAAYAMYSTIWPLMPPELKSTTPMNKLRVLSTLMTLRDGPYFEKRIM